MNVAFIKGKVKENKTYDDTETREGATPVRELEL